MRIVFLIFSGLFTIGIIYVLIRDGFTWEVIGHLIFFGGGFIFFLFQNRIFDWQSEQQHERINESFCQIRNDHIIFPKGYYFRYGFLADRKILPYELIDEFRINTHPVTAKINNNEVIFLLGLKRETIQQLAKNQNIPVVQTQDNWSLLCDQYLDTEFDEEQKANTRNRLIKAGINEVEQQIIHEKIRFRMLLQTYASWEWIYYGQYDVLRILRPMREKTYWWTMELALKEK